MNFGNLIKRHSVLIVAGGLGLCAVAVFALTVFMSGNLKKSVESQSIKTGKRIRSLSGSVVSRGQAIVESKYQDAFEADANAITNFGAQSTMRQLLSYDIFPEPKYSSQQLFDQFGENYRQSIGALIYRMNAKDCPSDDELNALRPATREGTGNIRGVAGGNVPSGASEEIEKIACDKRAEEIKTYANPIDMANYAGWENWNYNDRPDPVDDCWRSQLALWIQEDVGDTIAIMNGLSENVLISPVKRLLGISFNNKSIGPSSASTGSATGTYNPGRTGRITTTANTSFDFPSYVTSDATTSAIGTRAWTMRKCNDEIDVVHFSVAVIVEHQKVLAFMKELCSSKEHLFTGFLNQLPEKTLQHNQISILESSIEPVVNSDPEHKRYRYGDNPVVKLNLVCEYTFRRAGYDEIKPESIKEELGQSQTSGRDNTGRTGRGSRGRGRSSRTTGTRRSTRER